MFLKSQSSSTHLVLLDDLEIFLTNRALESVAINSGGSGYSVDDVLTLSGGTQTSLSQPAVVVVTAVSAGVITAVRIDQSGSYSSDPSTPNSPTGGGGTGASLTLTMADVGWTRKRRTQEAVSAVVPAGGGGSGYTIGDDLTVVGGVDVPTAAVFNIDSEGAVSATPNSGGSGYTVSDTLTLTGGTFTTAATFNVDSVSGGVVTAVSVVGAGDYTVTPSSPVSTTGGTGTGCTLDVTFGAAATVSLVTAGEYGETPSNPAATTSTSGSGATLTVTYQDYTGEFDLILEGEGSGADSVVIGFRTYTSGSVHNWELSAMTAYSATTPFINHPGISPGRFDGSGTEVEGAYVPLDTSSMTWWCFADGRRIIGVFKVGASTYTNMYLGWLNPFGTSTEFPYPMYVGGCSSLSTRLFSDTNIGYSGMTDPISAINQNTGPHLYRDPGGLWNTVRNSNETASGRSLRDEFVVYPCGSPGVTGVGANDLFSQGTNISTNLVPGTGNPGTPTAFMKQTPESPDEGSLPWPTMIIREGNGSTIPRDIHGELSGVYWSSADMDGVPATAVSEDILDDGNGTRYLFFQNCNRTELFSYFLIKEA